MKGNILVNNAMGKFRKTADYKRMKKQGVTDVEMEKDFELQIKKNIEEGLKKHPVKCRYDKKSKSTIVTEIDGTVVFEKNYKMNDSAIIRNMKKYVDKDVFLIWE